MDYYFWIKAAHIAAIVIFIGGMILNGFLLRHLSPAEPQAQGLLAAARFWNGPIIGSALLLVWVLGLTLAWLGGYFSDVWLMIKMTIVFVLSGMHGAQTAALRKLQQSPPVRVSGFMRNSAAITIIFLLFIVVLVVIQPFQ